MDADDDFKYEWISSLFLIFTLVINKTFGAVTRSWIFSAAHSLFIRDKCWNNSTYRFPVVNSNVFLKTGHFGFSTTGRQSTEKRYCPVQNGTFGQVSYTLCGCPYCLSLQLKYAISIYKPVRTKRSTQWTLSPPCKTHAYLSVGF